MTCIFVCMYVCMCVGVCSSLALTSSLKIAEQRCTAGAKVLGTCNLHKIPTVCEMGMTNCYHVLNIIPTVDICNSM